MFLVHPLVAHLLSIGQSPFLAPIQMAFYPPDANSPDQTLYIIREYFERTLDTPGVWQSLSGAKQVKIILGVLIGLSYLHDDSSVYAVAHGHLRPSNIGLDSGEVPVLLDYGFHAISSGTIRDRRQADIADFIRLVLDLCPPLAALASLRTGGPGHAISPLSVFNEIVGDVTKRTRFDELVRLSDSDRNEIERFASTNAPVPLGRLIALPPQSVLAQAEGRVARLRRDVKSGNDECNAALKSMEDVLRLFNDEADQLRRTLETAEENRRFAVACVDRVKEQDRLEWLLRASVVLTALSRI
jgi:hypothetical protein